MSRRKHAAEADHIAYLERCRTEAIAAFVAQTLDAALAFLSANALVVARRPMPRPRPPGLGRTDWEELANVAGYVNRERCLPSSLHRLVRLGFVEKSPGPPDCEATRAGEDAWIAGAVKFLKLREWRVLEELAACEVPLRRKVSALRYLRRVGLAKVARPCGVAVWTITQAGRAALVASGR